MLSATGPTRTLSCLWQPWRQEIGFRKPAEARKVPTHSAGSPASLVALLLLPAVIHQRRLGKRQAAVRRKAQSGAVSERPLLDKLLTSSVKTIEALELSRVKAQSEAPSAENGYWSGEPREWANDDSLTQRISSISQGGPLAEMKQFIAERLAGDYDREAVSALIDDKIKSNKLMMFSFSTCPFCLRAKDILRERHGVDFEVYECDLEPEGNAVRAELGKRTGRTSMPSTWLGPDVYIGGCNDGGLGGVAKLEDRGELRDLLQDRGLLEDTPWWQRLLGQPSTLEISRCKNALEQLCASAPKNGVGVSEELKVEVDEAAAALAPFCGAQPARVPLSGVWDLVYCTAPGGSSGKVGPVVGDVTQTFVDERRFVNAVELFGAVKVALEAEREVVDDTRIRVTFKATAFSIFGQELFRRPTSGSGVWVQRYVDDNLRVMDTPSLFVLRKRA